MLLPNDKSSETSSLFPIPQAVCRRDTPCGAICGSPPPTSNYNAQKANEVKVRNENANTLCISINPVYYSDRTQTYAHEALCVAA